MALKGEKYLYFRSDATLANDDDAAAGSNTYPLSSFLGMESVGDTTIQMFFKGKHNSYASGHDDATFGINDSVVITISTANNQKAVMKALVETFNNAKGSFLVVADDHSKEYLVGDIASVANFTVIADNA
jgi:hypothetical protein|tara:strand:+ start:176 stop:565 length:390 start_codon:yes stop_codon:yes gene_type:complete